MVDLAVFRPVPNAVHLTLLVPELIWPEPGDDQTLAHCRAPGLAWLAARAQATRQPRQPWEEALFACCARPPLGLATLRRLGEADRPDDVAGDWLCADPVHLRFHHERIVLADAGAFAIDAAQAAALVDGLNAQFSDLGHFEAATPRRWYVRLNAAVDHVAAPLSQVAGRRVDSELADKTGPLHRWLNEAQMVLHALPTNAARQASGEPAVNSLWLWGAGRPVDMPLPFDAVFGNDPLVAGLARHAGREARSCPAGLADLPASSSPLVVLDTLLPKVVYEDPEGWLQALAALDADWFTPLRGRLGRDIKKLDIVAPTVYGLLRWTLGAGARWQFWRGQRDVATLAGELAREGSPA